MDQTPKLNLPYILPAQAQKHVTHNEALRALDALVQLAVLDRDLAAPPASPAEGDCYIVAPAASGAWSGYEGDVAAWQDGAWSFHAPRPGWRAWVIDEGLHVAWTGAGWASAAIDRVERLGIATGADAINRLSVAASATLLTHGGAGHQLKVNKSGAGDTASVLLQTAFSGRAEIGTAGDDDLHVKVSPDGSTWLEALLVSRADGRVTFPRGAGQVQIDSFTASGTWTKPAWARQVTLIACSGGGGGGAGRRGAPASSRYGGGGGAGGQYNEISLLASELPDTLSVTVGAGGASGASAGTDNANGGTGGNGGATIIASGGINYLTAFGGSGGSGGTSAAGTGGAAPGGYYPSPSMSGGNGSNGGGGAPGLVSGVVPGAGAGGGGLSTSDAASGGATGGRGYRIGNSSSRTGSPGASSAAGSSGGAGGAKGWDRGSGGGGGGGGAHATTPGAGGDGGVPGGGGGGGGASANGTDSGAGGAGARGEAWIISIG